jgi:hypothetical protein
MINIASVESELVEWRQIAMEPVPRGRMSLAYVHNCAHQFGGISADAAQNANLMLGGFPTGRSAHLCGRRLGSDEIVGNLNSVGRNR